MAAETPAIDYLAIVKALYAAFAVGDIQAVIARTSADVVWICYAEQGFPCAGEYRGRAGVAEFFRRDGKTTSTTALVPAEYVLADSGNVVIATGYETGTMTVAGIAESGQWAHIWEFRGYEVIRFREYLSTTQQGNARVLLDAAPHEVRGTCAPATIVRASIHPSIGIARLGNSDEFFIGPEAPDQPPDPPGSHRDSAGHIRRQAARFRVYGYDEHGNVVRELTVTAGDAIHWRAHVANRKGSWYRSMVPMDIPEASAIGRRNPQVLGRERAKLAIDPGERSIAGCGTNGRQYAFDTGTFLDEPVYLGELRTDEAGRLLFLGGMGHSNSRWLDNTPTLPNHDYSTTDGWHDDISDGWVRAEVRLDNGQHVPCDGAWVITCPPAYAPGIRPVVSAWDAMYDTYLGNWIATPSSVSFTRDVYPILQRFCELQWVSYGFLARFGWRAPHHFLAPDMLARLADASAETAQERTQIFQMFRSPSYAPATMNELAWPPIYGDDMTVPPATARTWLALTNYQYGCLQSWAQGNFTADWDPDLIVPRRIEDIPVSAQPEALVRAALENVSGGPFHPGTEVGWPIRVATIYARPFQIRPRAEGLEELDYGEQLTPSRALATDGPLYSSSPGDITRWQGVPWQVDISGCQGGYEPGYDEYLPTFWPAHVPNQVLTHADYEFIMNPANPLEERERRFRHRPSWLGLLAADQPLTLAAAMVESFGLMGIVEARRGPADTPSLPSVMFVEGHPAPDLLPAKIAQSLDHRPMHVASRIHRAGRQRRQP